MNKNVWKNKMNEKKTTKNINRKRTYFVYGFDMYVAISMTFFHNGGNLMKIIHRRHVPMYTSIRQALDANMRASFKMLHICILNLGDDSTALIKSFFYRFLLIKHRHSYPWINQFFFTRG